MSIALLVLTSFFCLCACMIAALVIGRAYGYDKYFKEEIQTMHVRIKSLHADVRAVELLLMTYHPGELEKMRRNMQAHNEEHGLT